MSRASGDETVRRIIVKKGHGGGHHGGAWKVAYADFVTTMMALFIVLWIVGQSESVKQSVARYFRHPGIFRSGDAGTLMPGGAGVLSGMPAADGGDPANADAGDMEAAREERALQTAAEGLKGLVGSSGLIGSLRDQVRIEVVAEGLRIELVERENSPFFRVGSAALLDTMTSVLDTLASVLAQLPNPLVIEGHTDSRQYGKTRGYSNWELSTERANAARRVLEAAGLPPARVEQVIGHADRVLLIPGDPMDASNRRITLLVRRQGTPKAPIRSPSVPPGPPDPPEERSG